MRALLSVWEKGGLVEFARGLRHAGVDLVASGGTAAALAAASIEHVDVESVTGFPEMLGGRVKTLHPKIHGAILADLDRADHRASLAEHGVIPFDFVVSNLYPFASSPSIELIDIGGPAMVRAAAKNYAFVTVVTDPSQYDDVLAELVRDGAVSLPTRRALARAAFAHCSAYDGLVARWLADDTANDDEMLPLTLHLDFERAALTRYGENPHQAGARYRLRDTTPWWDGVTQLSGRELSYLNYFDADAAWRLVHELATDHPGERAVAIIKHANASGAAIAATLLDAYRFALDADPQSAFGGVVAVGGDVDDELAAVIAAGPQVDVIVARSFSSGAVDQLVARRRATRLLAAPRPEVQRLSVRTFGDGALVQEVDELLAAPESWTLASHEAPIASQRRDLFVAWRVCARTTSNAIVIARDGVAVGVGAGQQSRVVAATLAVEKAGTSAHGAAAASDAFFPFADGLAVLVAAGVTSVVQPGGSVRDAEIIAEADRAGLVMLLTGERHFRH